MNENYLLEVDIKEPDNFKKIRETLTRIGISDKKGENLYQTCHILHKRGRYYIVHFKEVHILDGKNAEMSEYDIYRRNVIAKMLENWNLLNIVNAEDLESDKKIFLKVIPFSEKKRWNLVPKCEVGKFSNEDI